MRLRLYFLGTFLHFYWLTFVLAKNTSPVPAIPVQTATPSSLEPSASFGTENRTSASHLLTINITNSPAAELISFTMGNGTSTGFTTNATSPQPQAPIPVSTTARQSSPSAISKTIGQVARTSSSNDTATTTSESSCSVLLMLLVGTGGFVLGACTALAITFVVMRIKKNKKKKKKKKREKKEKTKKEEEEQEEEENSEAAKDQWDETQKEKEEDTIAAVTVEDKSESDADDDISDEDDSSSGEGKLKTALEEVATKNTMDKTQIRETRPPTPTPTPSPIPFYSPTTTTPSNEVLVQAPTQQPPQQQIFYKNW